MLAVRRRSLRCCEDYCDANAYDRKPANDRCEPHNLAGFIKHGFHIQVLPRSGQNNVAAGIQFQCDATCFARGGVLASRSKQRNEINEKLSFRNWFGDHQIGGKLRQGREVLGHENNPYLGPSEP